MILFLFRVYRWLIVFYLIFLLVCYRYEGLFVLCLILIVVGSQWYLMELWWVFICLVSVLLSLEFCGFQLNGLTWQCYTLMKWNTVLIALLTWDGGCCLRLLFYLLCLSFCFRVLLQLIVLCTLVLVLLLLGLMFADFVFLVLVCVNVCLFVCFWCLLVWLVLRVYWFVLLMVLFVYLCFVCFGVLLIWFCDYVLLSTLIDLLVFICLAFCGQFGQLEFFSFVLIVFMWVARFAVLCFNGCLLFELHVFLRCLIFEFCDFILFATCVFVLTQFVCLFGCVGCYFDQFASCFHVC